MRDRRLHLLSGVKSETTGSTQRPRGRYRNSSGFLESADRGLASFPGEEVSSGLDSYRWFEECYRLSNSTSATLVCSGENRCNDTDSTERRFAATKTSTERSVITP